MSTLLLLVTICGERVAVPALAVEAVVEVESIAPVPRAPAHVLGLTALRSRVLTVIAWQSERCRSAADGEPPVALLVEHEGHPYALIVDAVEDVFEHQGELGPLKSRLSPRWGQVASGIVAIEGDPLLVLDVPALLSHHGQA